MRIREKIIEEYTSPSNHDNDKNLKILIAGGRSDHLMKLLGKIVSLIRRRKIAEIDLDKVIDKSLKGKILSFDESMTLLNSLEEKLSKEPQLIKLDGKVVFVGDTHGDLESSKQVFEKFSTEEYTIIFLGDYVDRGKQQLENVNFLLAKYIQSNGKVVLLRGNHESPVVNMNYGFMDVLYHTYSSEWLFLFVRYNEILANLPYAAKVKKLLAVHGGIAEGLEDLKQIENLPKKDMIPSNRIAFQILWNDPSDKVEEFADNISRGGNTRYYGKKALEKFLHRNRLEGLVRAHEAYPDGFAWLFRGKTSIEGMNHILLSIFTCRYYGIPPTVAVFDGNKMEVKRL